MKKIILLVILALGLISCNKKSTEAEARKVLHSHLEQRYGEPFWIGPMGIRATDEKMWYEAEIMPSKYIGTPKERDKYYHSVGTVRINKNKWGGEKLGKGSDVYMSVRLNESANEYFLPKLQELFGNQVLPVIQMRVWEVEDNGDYIKTYEHNKKEKGYFFIQGGIYIFTRIDDLEMKEKYRQKIYELIQYIKSQDMFWQVDLAIYILDERCLTNGFEKEIGKNLVIARNRLKTADEFNLYRKEQMKKLNKEFEEMKEDEVLNKIDSFIKSYLGELYKRQDNKYSIIYHTSIRSPKFLEFETRLKGYVIKNYETYEDVKLYNTTKINYDEYNIEELEKNLWDGE